ncbi:uncharacterized protein LAJ45_00003 [Morchella importuna]|uniref:uncharacterized protein n=1 Tax=Morchella importuna TaxID=1174673 RepID=UPI001E8DD9EC|nr:uncharacterized protein LAJ45_00003 [Morchella importuna]KAH8154995.1 hypothetical protein LAJ45_00003 [Morchella importuna]
MESIHGNYPTFEIAWRANKFMKIVRHAPRGSVPKVVNRKLIADRGKADGIGNALALIQAFSIVFQCFFRKMKGLTVTLLEFHVVVQVLCSPSTTEEKGILAVIETIPNINMRDRRDLEEALTEPISGKDADGANTLPPPGGLFSRSTLAEICERLKGLAEGDMWESFLRLEILRRHRATRPAHFITYSIYGAAHSIA